MDVDGIECGNCKETYRLEPIIEGFEELMCVESGKARPDGG